MKRFPAAPTKLLKCLAICAMLVWAGGQARAVAAPEPDSELINVEINKGAMVKLSRPAASVVIADPNTADVEVVSPRLVFVRGKKIGETSMYAIDADDEPIISAIVDVTHNLTNMERAVKRVAPDADIGFKTVDGGLVMDGFAGSVNESENIRDIASAFLGPNDKMVNMIQTSGSDQVMLKVKFVEMARTDLKKLGVNLQHLASHGNFGLQVLQGNDIGFYGSDPTITYFRTFDSLLKRGTSTDDNILLRYKDLAGVVDALETQGLATTLAEPTLTTTTGKAANFLAGGQFPIPTAGQNGTVTIQYQPFGVSLNFTPTVMNKDRISLTVAPEVSTLNFSNPIQVSGITYPILNTRKASAVVELGSGDSFMLAGLLQSDSSNNINKFPGLGDVPIIGTLFRSTQFQNNQTELVILVTPFIVHPVAEASKLQTPTDGYKPPSDLQMMLEGRLYRQQPMTSKTKDKDKYGSSKSSASAPQLHGDGGFILE